MSADPAADQAFAGKRAVVTGGDRGMGLNIGQGWKLGQRAHRGN